MFADYLARYYVDTYLIASCFVHIFNIINYHLRSLEQLGVFGSELWPVWRPKQVAEVTFGWPGKGMSHLSRPVAMDNTMKFKEVDSQEVVWCMRCLYLFTLFWHPARQKGRKPNQPQFSPMQVADGGSFSSKTLERSQLCSLPWEHDIVR